jgi:signal peptidase I
MKLRTLIGAAFLITAGILIGLLIASKQANANNDWQDTPASELSAFNPFQDVTPKESPKDRVADKAIAVYKDRVILDVQDVQWATFTDTHSMEPVIFKGANALEITPKSEDDIKVGDIVSYKSDYAEGNIIHRVVYKGQDEKGTYFVMKGDNIPTSDPGRIRFSQMQRVVIGLVY